jgi:hypothetical protein
VPTPLPLLLVLSLVPAQAGRLNLANVRTTYGVLGASRPDTRILPGDHFVVSFDIEGLKTDDAGKVHYGIGMEVSDAAGKVHLKQDPHELETTNSLGGTSLQAFASLQVGLDQPPGTYRVKVTAIDRTTRAMGTLTQAYEVLPKGFGLVRFSTTYDSDGKIQAPFVGEGQNIFVNFLAVGFGRDKAQGQPNLSVAMRILDENGRPTLAKPFMGEISKEVPEKALSVPMQFMIELNRPGKFTVELKATDKVTGQTATLSYPLDVLKLK